MRCASSWPLRTSWRGTANNSPARTCSPRRAELYKSYLSDLQREGVPPVDMPGWRQRQIAAAVPVKGSNVAFRSDELLGVEVRSPDDVALGSVDDLALNPETGKLGYLVIARGGIFGFDETRIPDPLGRFQGRAQREPAGAGHDKERARRRAVRSARTRSRLAQAPIARARKWTPIGRRTSPPKRAIERQASPDGATSPRGNRGASGASGIVKPPRLPSAARLACVHRRGAKRAVRSG